MNKSVYDIETYVADIYDQIVDYTNDIKLLQKLIQHNKYKVLEPFCGTGRISISLLQDGHSLTGIDNAKGMLDWFELKLKKLKTKHDVQLLCQNVLQQAWPTGFDLVVMGGNCFYELATAKEQEMCIKRAANSLKQGGFLFIDNDHMEGDLAPSWQDIGVTHKSLCGIAQDGSTVETTRKTVWFDIKNRLTKIERYSKIVKPSNEVIEASSIQQKHPVSSREVKEWLQKHGFKILKHYGNYNCEPYQDSSARAIFWAVKI